MKARRTVPQGVGNNANRKTPNTTVEAVRDAKDNVIGLVITVMRPLGLKLLGEVDKQLKDAKKHFAEAWVRVDWPETSESEE